MNSSCDKSLLAFLQLLIDLFLLVQQHRIGPRASVQIGSLSIKGYLFLLLTFVLAQCDPMVLCPEYIGPLGRQTVQVSPNIDLLSLRNLTHNIFLFLPEAGFEMFVHLGSQDILPADMALLQNFLSFRLRNNFLLQIFTSIYLLLLYSLQQLPSCYIFTSIVFKTDSLHQLKIIPIYIALLNLLCLLFFASSLLLFCHVVFKYFFAFVQNCFTALCVLFQLVLVLLTLLEDVCIGLNQGEEVWVVFRGWSEKLELWIVFLSLAQGHQEIFAVFGAVLSRMLYHRLITLRQLLGQFCHIFLRIRFLQLRLENILQKFLLLIYVFFFLLDNFRLLNSFFLHFLFLMLHSLQHLLTNFSNSMIIVGSKRTISFEKRKFNLILFPFHQNLLECQSISRYMFCSFLQQFQIAPRLLLISAGGIIKPIISFFNLSIIKSISQIQN